MEEIGRLLFTLGLLLAFFGIVLWLGGRFFPQLGNLPGDFRFERGNVKIFFPLATMIIISIVCTIILNIIIRWFNR